MATTKTDRAFKTLINKRTTSEDKRAFEEFGDRTINVHGSEVWADDIAEDDPAQAILDGAAEVRTLFELTRDTTVGGDQAWYADLTGTRLKDWISDKYGPSYAAHLYDGSDNEIFPTDASDWFFDYQTGILTFSGNPSGFDKPFKVTGYRYIGAKGAGGGGVAGPGSSTDTALPRWSGTGGDTLLDSNVTLSAADAMVFPTGGSISKPGTGSNSESFGAGALANEQNSFAAGNSAKVYPVSSGDSYGAVALGRNAVIGNSTPGAGCDAAICVGQNALVNPGASNAVVVGAAASASSDGANSVSVGVSAVVSGSGSVAIGDSATVHAPGSGDSSGAIAVGASATIGAAAGVGCAAAICVGESASVGVGSLNAVCIGAGASATQKESVCIGNLSGANVVRGVVIGYDCQVDYSAGSSIAVGVSAWAHGRNSLATGLNARVHNPTSGANDNAIAIGTGATVGSATGAGVDAAIAFGRLSGVGVGASEAIAFGSAAKVYEVSSGDSAGSIAIGSGAEIGNSTPGAGCNAAICIGENASVGTGSSDCVAIGSNASIGTNTLDGMCLGPDSLLGDSCESTLVVGHGANTVNNVVNSVVMGAAASITGGGGACVIIGQNADSNAASQTGVGHNIDCRQAGATGLGRNVVADGASCLAVGFGASVNGADNAVAAGPSASVGAGHTNSMALGVSAATTAANRVTFASTLEVEIGQGLAVWGVTPPSSQPAKINDPTDLASCITSITAIIDALEGAGVTSAT